uniref:Uncharacterized protein n=1 Tax=Aegilops tauschii subsp. strangulata TaxID=200361 RepID=A0A453QQD1_AEGTS
HCVSFLSCGVISLARFWLFILGCCCWSDGWEKSWETGVTPWDLGKPTPIIEHLVKSGTLPKGRALVPGCGMV